MSHINKACGPLLLRRRSALPVLLTVLAIGFALMAIAQSAARGRFPTLKSACIEVPGYEALPDYGIELRSGFSFPQNDDEGKDYPNASSALLACDSDPTCVGYNTDGVTITQAGLISVAYVSELRTCLWIKIGSSEAYSGYTRRPYLSWSAADSATVFVDTASAAAAKEACDQNPACTAWNTAGQFAIGAVDTQAFPASPGGTTLYLKPVCRDKFGYTSYYGYTLSGLSGVSGLGTGKMPGGGADAADFCRLDYRCTAFSTDGSYAIGGVDLNNVGGTTCTYVKEPCAPIRGFAAVNDQNSHSAPDSRPYYNCFSDVYKACLNDPECIAFNNVRNIWKVEPDDYVDAPGICFYLKL
ncbi:hypothetical protein VaNZ11_008672 [Volvox africanus]|uniref:Uncharacterized protein n=1 Tax=Volvox africanus TaxID=51714 RepID=A0ABQ5S682_9CHLO|nr:hypothetical protein VaNZ11_008672 [Volvox africanus]